MAQPVSGRPARGGRVWRRNPRLAEQVLGGKAVVLHYEGRRVLGLNDTGTLLWTLVDGRRREEEIAAEAGRRLAVPPEEIPAFRDSVFQFFDDLSRRELLVPASMPSRPDPEGPAGAERDAAHRRSGEVPEERR